MTSIQIQWMILGALLMALAKIAGLQTEAQWVLGVLTVVIVLRAGRKA